MTKQKIRLDIFLAENNYFPSRNRAQAEIMAGNVFVDNKKITKAGIHISPDSIINIKKNTNPYVSRAGLKIESAVKKYPIVFKDKIIMDIGISTGGFTDFALQNDAKLVYGIDVGYGQVANRIRNNNKVILFERTNFRYFDLSLIKNNIDIVLIDVSFIGLEKIIVRLNEKIFDNAIIVALFKPQFEVPKDKTVKGIVKEEKYTQIAINKFKVFLYENNFKFIDIIKPDIKGTKGNQEYFVLFHRQQGKK